jgi:hypothetical protein
MIDTAQRLDMVRGEAIAVQPTFSAAPESVTTGLSASLT